MNAVLPLPRTPTPSVRCGQAHEAPPLARASPLLAGCAPSDSQANPRCTAQLCYFSEGLIFVLQPIRSSTARWWGVVDSQRLLPSENRCQFAVPSCSCPTEPGYGAYKPERCHAPKRCPDVAVCSALGHRLHCHLCRLTVALMGHPVRYATEPHAAPKSSTSACASCCRPVLAGLRLRVEQTRQKPLGAVVFGAGI